DEGWRGVATAERDIGTTDGHAFEAICWHCNDGRLLQQSQAVETGFNLAQLNSVTTTFYLGVGSPQKIDEPVLSHFCQVAGFIQAPSGRGQKGRPLFRFTPPITGAQADAADTQVPHLPGRYRPQMLVQHVQGFAITRTTNGNGLVRISREAWHC